MSIKTGYWIQFAMFMVKQIKQLPIRSGKIVKDTLIDSHVGTIIKHLEADKNLRKLGYMPPETNYKLLAAYYHIRTPRSYPRITSLPNFERLTRRPLGYCQNERIGPIIRVLA